MSSSFQNGDQGDLHGQNGGVEPSHKRGERDSRTKLRPHDVSVLPSRLTELYRTSEDYLIAVGNRIKERRREVGYDSQTDFAEALGASQSYVSKVERGDGLKLLIALTNIAATLECSLDFIAIRTDDPNPFIPENFDDLTIVYQPQNAHHRASVIQMLNIMEELSPAGQLALMREALTYVSPGKGYQVPKNP